MTSKTSCACSRKLPPPFGAIINTIRIAWAKSRIEKRPSAESPFFSEDFFLEWVSDSLSCRRPELRLRAATAFVESSFGNVDERQSNLALHQ